MASDALDRLLGGGSTLRDRLLPDRRRLGFDALAVATWVLAVAAAFHGVGVPTWLYYGVVAAGVLGYSLLAARAERTAERARRGRGSGR